jgi:hypothetical protein
VFASHFPSDEVQNEAEIRGSTPVSFLVVFLHCVKVSNLVFLAEVVHGIVFEQQEVLDSILVVHGPLVVPACSCLIKFRHSIHIHCF